MFTFKYALKLFDVLELRGKLFNEFELATGRVINANQHSVCTLAVAIINYCVVSRTF